MHLRPPVNFQIYVHTRQMEYFASPQEKWPTPREKRIFLDPKIIAWTMRTNSMAQVSQVTSWNPNMSQSTNVPSQIFETRAKNRPQDETKKFSPRKVRLVYLVSFLRADSLFFEKTLFVRVHPLNSLYTTKIRIFDPEVNSKFNLSQIVLNELKKLFSDVLGPWDLF